MIRAPGQDETGCSKFDTKGFILMLHPNPTDLLQQNQARETVRLPIALFRVGLGR